MDEPPCSKLVAGRGGGGILGEGGKPEARSAPIPLRAFFKGSEVEPVASTLISALAVLSERQCARLATTIILELPSGTRLLYLYHAASG